MAQIGVTEYQDSAGAWHEIAIYDPGTFSVEPVEIQLSDGSWGVPFLRTPSDADTPFEVQKSDGSWLGINTVGVFIIDNFEDGNRGGWTVPSSTGSDTVESPGLNGTDFAWTQNGFREAHLAGADAVDRGPQPGDLFEFWFRITSTSGSVINRFEFSAAAINESDVYRVEFENGTGDDELSIQKISGGSPTLTATDPGGVSVDQTYRAEIGWNVSGDNISVQLFDPSGNPQTDHIWINDDSSAAGSDYQQPGVFIRTNANNTCRWDEIRILPG